jgi:hypothetical protein
MILPSTKANQLSLVRRDKNEMAVIVITMAFTVFNGFDYK